MGETEAAVDIYAALARAQADFKTVQKNCTAKVRTKGGTEYSYKYADLQTVLSAVTPVLAKHGISLHHEIHPGEKHNAVLGVLTMGGEQITCRCPIYHGVDMQALGSALTYARRYTTQMLCGIAPDDDDDGQKAATDAPAPPMPSSQPAPPEQAHQASQPARPSSNSEGQPSPVCPPLEKLVANLHTKQTYAEMETLLARSREWQALRDEPERFTAFHKAALDHVGGLLRSDDVAITPDEADNLANMIAHNQKSLTEGGAA